MNSSKNMQEIAGALSTRKICRLFGEDITIDCHSDHKSTTSNEIHDMVTHVDEEMKKQQNFIMLFGVCIYRHDSSDVTTLILDQEADPDVAQPPPPSPPPPPLILGEKVFLFEKKLTLSDVCPGQNRLLIPKGDRTKLMADLTDEEKEKVLINKSKNDFLSVLTTDKDGVEYTLHLNLWTSSNAIVLTHQWRKLVDANGLKVGDWVQVWGYRVQPHDLRLQIIKKLN